MPKTLIYFYKDSDGKVPVYDWLMSLYRRDRDVFAKCTAKIGRLGEEGNQLRRPECDYLRDGIWELRIRCSSIHYRILYFFCGKNVCVLAHALTKEGKVPSKAIAEAILRKQQYESNPDAHTYIEIE